MIKPDEHAYAAGEAHGQHAGTLSCMRLAGVE